MATKELKQYNLGGGDQPMSREEILGLIRAEVDNYLLNFSGRLVSRQGLIKSKNYQPDTSGWEIDAQGDAEFSNIKLRNLFFTNERLFIGGPGDGAGTAQSGYEASITRQAVNTYMEKSGSTSTTSYFRLYYDLGYSDALGSTISWNDNFDMVCRVIVDTASASNSGYIWGLFVNSENATGSDIIDRHVGFLVKADGNLYASNADGSGSRKKTSLSIDPTTEHNYRIVFTAGSSAKFYVDGELVAEHTTLLPSGSATLPAIVFSGGHSVAASDTLGMLVYNNYRLLVS